MNYERAEMRGEYRELVELLDQLTDTVGENEGHPLA
jgi:hypothetical protein